MVVPVNPLSALEAGTYNRVPLLVGCTTEELKLFLPLILVEPRDLWAAVQEFDPEAPALDLGEFIDPALWPLLPLYEPLTRMAELGMEGFGVDAVARAASRHQEVFVYSFDWGAEPEPFDFFIGAAHAMDIPFIMGTFSTSKESLACFAWCEANRPPRERLSRAMMGYFSWFARTGNPNGGAPDLPAWRPWSNDPGEPRRMVFDVTGPHMTAR